MSADPAPSGLGTSRTTQSAAQQHTTEVVVSPLRHAVEDRPRGKRLLVLSFTALGVVYGDIGTSPLYAIRECFKEDYGLVVTPLTVYGILSLIIWALTLIVTVKYVGFILRADNRGEGGVLALLALVLERRRQRPSSRLFTALVMLGLFGGALLYGDGIITPAISVLGAVEGLAVASPGMPPAAIIAIAFVIIALLFYFQSRGTARVGGTFGWIMLAWFISISALGVRGILMHPEILASFNPVHALVFAAEYPVRAFVVLGAVVLVVTGGEALYADLGHFGPRPIRVVWLCFVFPALLLNYLGQGALLLSDPSAIKNPFYLLAPSWYVLPMLIIATCAAVVASQALISGAFSLTHQAVQLGYAPRVTVVHTSRQETGQIYIPEVNQLLAIGTLLLVVGFGSSTALGSAYGVAVTGTMAITTILFCTIARDRWSWSALQAGAFLVVFLSIELLLFAANLLKAGTGGWVPLLIAATAFTLMTTWKRGRDYLRSILAARSLPVEDLLKSLDRGSAVRVPGTAIFMTSESSGTPVVLLHHLKHNKVLHERVILLSVIVKEVPEVPPEERLTIEDLTHGIYRVKAYYGFMQTPNVEEIRARLVEAGIRAPRMETTYYLGREQLIPVGSSGMARWRKWLFAVMARNARSATQYFGIPPNRVVELGAQIEF
ncbi:MAG TPA: potassium transporter Kup [Gemmatimonadaceae bacterium]|nr:potassium transporter Kup [Gemmatimonadaceae bacterium]